MRKKAKSLALALAKADREAPKLLALSDEDETTRPLSIDVIAMLAAERDPTMLMRLPLLPVPEGQGLQIGDEDKEDVEE